MNSRPVSVSVTTCMGKGHFFTVPFVSIDNKLLFIDAKNSTPYISGAQRQQTIVPNTEITTLLNSEPCCSITVESYDCTDMIVLWTFHSPFKVNVNHSIDFLSVDLIVLNKLRGVTE